MLIAPNRRYSDVSNWWSHRGLPRPPAHSVYFVRLLRAGSPKGPAWNFGDAMKPPRRKFLRLAAGAAALPAMSRIARAEAFPSRPITMVVPVSAGGAMDTNARLVAEGWSCTSPS